VCALLDYLQLNYEIDKTVRYVKRTGGSVTKMSVAIVINEAALLRNSAEGATAGVPMTVDQAQLDSLTMLVKSCEAGHTLLWVALTPSVKTRFPLK